MGFELEVDNYRALRRIRWKAEGVCALVGPNGSGKTTLLSVLGFLRTAAVSGFGKALNAHGGAHLFRHRQATTDEPVHFAFTVSDLKWEAEPSTGGTGIITPVPERLLIEGQVVAEQRAGEEVLRLLAENKPLGEQSFLFTAVAALTPQQKIVSQPLLLAMATSVAVRSRASWPPAED